MKTLEILDTSVIALYGVSLRVLSVIGMNNTAEVDFSSLPIQNIEFGKIAWLLSEKNRYAKEGWYALGSTPNDQLSGQISFVNNVNILFDMGRVMIEQKEGELVEDIEKPDMVRFSRRLLDEIKRIKPAALGINFTGFLECIKPDEFLNNLVNIKSKDFIKSSDIRLICDYENDNNLLNINLSKLEVKSENQKKLGISIKANFHIAEIELKNMGYANVIATLPKKRERFQELAQELLHNVK